MPSWLDRANAVIEKGIQRIGVWWEKFTNGPLPPGWRQECTPVSEEEMVEIRRRQDGQKRRAAETDPKD